MALSKTFIIVLSLLMALVMFSKHIDQCCDAFADVSTTVVDLQIADEEHMNADEPVALFTPLISFHPVQPLIINGILSRYDQPDLPVSRKPPRV